MYLSYTLALLPLALAQYTNYSDSSSASYYSNYLPSSTASSSTAFSTSIGNSNSNSTTHLVTVGNGALVFSPENIVAAPGDKIQFSFFPLNHSVSQSVFANPCTPLAGGFFSGFVPTPSGVNPRTFTLTVNDTRPLWIYCSQGRHCASGMAMVINEPSGPNSLAAYKAAASNATTVSPRVVQGGVFGNGNSTSNSTLSGGPGANSTVPDGTGTAGIPVQTANAAYRGTSPEWVMGGLAGLIAVAWGRWLV